MYKSYNWVPVFGEFGVKNGTVIFHGKLIDSPSSDRVNTLPPAAPSNQIPALGTILSDQHLATGTVSVEVNFQEIGPGSACQIVFGYEVERGAFLAAGITAETFAAFSIREWQPGIPGS